MNINNVDILLIPNHSDAICNWKCVYYYLQMFCYHLVLLADSSHGLQKSMPALNQSAPANHAWYTLGDMKHCTNMQHNVFHSYLLNSSVSQRILLDKLGWQVSATENWKSVVQTNASNYRVTHVANLGSAWLWAFQLENIMPKIKLPLVFKGMEHKHKACFSHLFNLVITWARESYFNVRYQYGHQLS